MNGFTRDQGNLIRQLVMTSNNNHIYAATSDGIYRTTDAGQNWNRVQEGYFIDIEIHPTRSNTLYASIFDNTGNGNAQVYAIRDMGRGHKHQTSTTLVELTLQ